MEKEHNIFSTAGLMFSTYLCIVSIRENSSLIFHNPGANTLASQMAKDSTLTFAGISLKKTVEQKEKLKKLLVINSIGLRFKG